MSNSAAPAKRRENARETFVLASESIGPVTRGMSVFLITRGQWSMIDAILYCLSEVGESFISVWTWTVAEYEIEVMERLMIDERIIGARLIIDHGARVKNLRLIQKWRKCFGIESVRYVLNHAKIATIESSSGFKMLLRGSMNLNKNMRFEQCDITEGGPEFDLVKNIEIRLPALDDDCSGAEVFKGSKCGDAFGPDEYKKLGTFKTWRK